MNKKYCGKATETDDDLGNIRVAIMVLMLVLLVVEFILRY